MSARDLKLSMMLSLVDKITGPASRVDNDAQGWRRHGTDPGRVKGRVEWCSWFAPCLGFGCGLGGDELLITLKEEGGTDGVGGEVCVYMPPITLH
jgi:hypothetical protein